MKFNKLMHLLLLLTYSETLDSWQTSTLNTAHKLKDTLVRKNNFKKKMRFKKKLSMAVLGIRFSISPPFHPKVRP